MAIIIVHYEKGARSINNCYVLPAKTRYTFACLMAILLKSSTTIEIAAFLCIKNQCIIAQTYY